MMVKPSRQNTPCRLEDAKGLRSACQSKLETSAMISSYRAADFMHWYGGPQAGGLVSECVENYTTPPQASHKDTQGELQEP